MGARRQLRTTSEVDVNANGETSTGSLDTGPADTRPADTNPIDLVALLSRVSQEALLVLAGETTASGARDFRIVWTNTVVCSFLGQSLESLRGRPLFDFFPREGRLFELLVRAEASGQEENGEVDVHPLVAPITRVGYRIRPESNLLVVSITDRSPLREAQARATLMEQFVSGGAELSTVGAAILQPVFEAGQVTDFAIEYVNDFGCQLLGRDRVDVLGHRTSEFGDPTRAVGFTDTMRKSWRSGTAAVFEISLENTKVHARWLRCHVIPLTSNLVIHFDDISERRLSDAALEASEHRYRSLFETANEGIALTDVAGNYRVVNAAFAAMFGVNRTDLVGTSSISSMADGEREQAVATASTAFKTGQSPRRRQTRLRRPDGTEFWAVLSINFTHDADGEVDGYLVLAQDVDDQIRGAEALAASESRYRAIVEHAEMLIALTDRDGTIVYANDRLVDTLAMTREEVQSRSSLTCFPPEERPGAIRDFTALSDGAASFTATPRTLLTADGRRVPVVGSAVALRTADGAFEGAILVAADMTTLVKQENARREMAAALAVAEQRERERLASDLHDGPVQTLVALSMRLGSALNTSSVDLGLIMLAEGLVTKTIRDLRMLLFQLSPPDLDSMTLGTCLLDRAETLLDPSVEIILDDRLQTRVDPRTIEALFRIGQEALVNVAKHASATETVIRLYETNDDVVIEIIDNGVGGTPDAFHRSSDGHIGVPGMLERALQLGGKCEIIPAPGQGTTVLLRLPIGPVQVSHPVGG